MDDKVTIAVVSFCFNDHTLEWWTSKNTKEPKWVKNFTWVGFKSCLL